MKEWDQFWKKYKISDAERYYIMYRDTIIRRSAESVGKTKIRVLEAGCGFGSNSRILNADSQYEVHCIDLSKEAISMVKEEISRAYIGDITKMPFKDNSFDIIFSAGVIEHFKDDSEVVKEFCRITASNGVIVTFVPGRYTLWQIYKLLMGKRWCAGYERNYTMGMLKHSFLKHKMNIIDSGGIDPFSINALLLKLFNIRIAPNISLPSAFMEIYLCVKKL
jgi:SAM-dependent methyltransferase